MLPPRQQAWCKGTKRCSHGGSNEREMHGGNEHARLHAQKHVLVRKSEWRHSYKPGSRVLVSAAVANSVGH
eukprot:1157716-Pelagomonas_calceolata.AAC.5